MSANNPKRTSPQQAIRSHRVTAITLFFAHRGQGDALFFRDCADKSAQQPQSSFQQPSGCGNHDQKQNDNRCKRAEVQERVKNHLSLLMHPEISSGI
jgi:hypothetical protein